MEPKHLAVSNLERDVLEGDAVAEALRQSVDDKRGDIAVPYRSHEDC
jgi:hypothetical protein